MKLSLSAIALALAFACSAQATPLPAFHPATFTKIYVPAGFDSNDHVQIVGEGMFRNTCYRPANVTVNIDRHAKKVYVGPVAYEYPGFCLQVVLPFNRTIDIGVLSAGTWEVVQQANGSKLGVINVRPSLVDTADDFTYAPIAQAFFKQETNSVQVLLTGNFLTNCMALDDIKLTIEEEVIVVQPIVKTEERRNCMSGEFPFKSWAAIDFLKAKRYLLHVRSMNGNAINSLIDMQ